MNIIVIKNIVVLIVSIIFLLFGVALLIDSFSLANPLEFVMTLFSASFIILFCLVGILYAFFRFYPKKIQDGCDDVNTK